MAQSKKRTPEETRKILEKHERSARLLANDDFKEYWEELTVIARMEGLNSLRPEKSNFERAMTAGILDFMERQESKMALQARPETLKKLRNSLEESENARTRKRAGKHEPARYAGIDAIGEF